MNVLLKNKNNFEISPTIALQLFDSFVGSILSYACPVCGFSKTEERVQLKFCKPILGVKLSNSNAAAYCELGRYSFYINRYVQILRYWFSLLQTNNIRMSAAYDNTLNKCNIGMKNLAHEGKCLRN